MPPRDLRDLDLWYAYATRLKRIFIPSDDPLDHNLRIYMASLTSTGVTIGSSIPDAVTNSDIYRLGDMLLPEENPVFNPGASFSKRLKRYLDSVDVPSGNQDIKTLTELQNGEEQLQQLTDRFLECRGAAFEKYQQDPQRSELSFAQWQIQYYPPYQVAQFQMEAAVQKVFSILAVYYGEQAWALWNDKRNLNRALSGIPDFPYNMVTASTQVTHAQVTETSTTPPVVDPSTITYQPTYNIDSSFRAVTEAWIATAGQQGKEPFKLEFSAGGCSHPDKEWENVGFESVRHSSDDVAPILPLFTTSQACDGNHNKLKTSLGDEGHDSRVTVTLTASDAKVFNINSGNWDLPNAARTYPYLRENSSPDLYTPLVRVRQVLLGYKVALSIKTSPHIYHQINDGLETAKTNGVPAKLIGLDIGSKKTASVDFHQIECNDRKYTLSIPPRDDTQLTLIGLMGRKLATPDKSGRGPTFQELKEQKKSVQSKPVVV